MKRSRATLERDWRLVVRTRERKQARKTKQRELTIELIERHRLNPVGTKRAVATLLGENVEDVVFSEGKLPTGRGWYSFRDLLFVGRGGKDLLSALIDSHAGAEREATLIVRGEKTGILEIDWGPGLLEDPAWKSFASAFFEVAPMATLLKWRLVCTDWRNRIDGAGFCKANLPLEYRTGTKVPWPFFVLHFWFDPTYAGRVPGDLATMVDVVRHRAALEAPDAVAKLPMTGQGEWTYTNEKGETFKMTLERGGYMGVDGPPGEDPETHERWSVKDLFNVSFSKHFAIYSPKRNVKQIVSSLVRLATAGPTPPDF